MQQVTHQKMQMAVLLPYLAGIIAAVILLAILLVLSRFNYPFFIIVIELASIAVSIAIFSLTWNARRMAKDTFLIAIGFSFLLTAIMDAVYVFALIDASIFRELTLNHSVQLWIAARYIQSATLFIALLLIGRSITRDRKYDTVLLAISFTAVTAMLLMSILVWKNFPACEVIERGYTPFKIASEYAISLLFIAGLAVIVRKKEFLDKKIWFFLVMAQILLIAGECSFAISATPFDQTNLLGFYFRFASVYCIYSAIVVVGITRPFDLLFHKLDEQEKALRLSEERYRSVVEDQTELISRFRPDGTHVFVNDAYCRFFNIPREEILGKKFLPHLLPPEKAQIKKTFGSLSREQPFITDTNRMVMPDGSTRWVRWNDRAIFDDGGKIVEYQSVGRDITAMRQASDALEFALRKLTLLSSITRHDLLNQLTALKTYIELADAQTSDPAIRKYLETMQKITTVIDDQISFTKDYDEMGTNAPRWNDVAAVIRRSIDALPMRDVRPVIDLEGIEVYADPLFEKVFYNLIDNALRYGGEHLTTIRFTATEDHGTLTLVCADDGAGIAPGDKPRLFEKGFGHHTGLGLFLVREILSITGISISETGEPGGGARFGLAVPRDAWRSTRS